MNWGSNALNSAFSATELDEAYLAIQPALYSVALLPLLTTKQPMSNIGESFTDWYAYLTMLYTIKLVPADAYEAIFFVRKATPMTMLEE